MTEHASEHQSFYLTTPIYYVNAQPHLGTAYTTLLADVQARFRRAQECDVHFLTGLDEHGQKVANTAAEHDMSPQEWCDHMAPAFTDLWSALEISNDDFIRTTEQRHKDGVQAFWRVLEKSGYIYKDTYDGWYCIPDETYFTETQVRHYNEEAGDPEGHACPGCGRALERIKEESWFFKLSAFEQPLLDLYEENPTFVQPAIRRNEVLSFVRGGLKDLSISRTTFDWGIPFPFDEEHITYVWVDALLNYATAVGYGDSAKEGEFAHRWPAQLHVIGKDIIRFHCVIWPAILMAAGLPIPEQVFVHGFLLTKGEKMSKSRGNAISPYELLDVFGVDAYRYYFMTDVQHGADSSISIERMVQVYNADLANSWGNLVSRSLNMCSKYCDGVTPTLPDSMKQETSPLSEYAACLYGRYETAMENLDYQGAARAVQELVSRANLYIEERMPWALAKDPEKKDELEAVIYHLLEAIRIVAYLLAPFTPDTSAEVLRRMSQAPRQTTPLSEVCTWGRLQPGKAVEKGEALFPRLDLDDIEL